MKLFSNRKRPFYLGPYPLERLQRLPAPQPAKLQSSNRHPSPVLTGFARIVRSYIDGLHDCDRIPINPSPVPLPAIDELTREIKATCYFLDASLVGVCEVESGVHTLGDHNRCAIVVAVEHGREPERDNTAAEWIRGTVADCGALRATEIVTVVSGYIRQLGYEAHLHAPHHSPIALSELAFCAGIVAQRGGALVAPFIGGRFAIAAVVTSLPLAPDRPLATQSVLSSVTTRITHTFGVGGTKSALEQWRLNRRASHLGTFPMEKIRRRDRPTTLIVDDEVPRVPERANFFVRAAHGDLGAKTQRERNRFATKHPLAYAMTPLLDHLATRQDGSLNGQHGRVTESAESNARAVKSLAYFLGADMVGICEMPRYAWYSHDKTGQAIDGRHRYAIVLLIDQGQETTEGTSGDDWISGSQSMRAYLRGAGIAGLIAAQLRHLGYAARAQTSRDSQVLHLPLLLLAGLGELSRIGELVLNPFLGPRSKSVVITTDMPLAVDRPIDFGLQDTCNKCRKCARECPCNAISYRGKVMFNGYEMWKPDVERCTRYRVTNPKGSSCGRCMKVCPFANEGLVSHRFFLWAAIRVPLARRWIVRLDDLVRNGARNPIKKWWRDLSRTPDGTVRTPSGTNARDLRLGKESSVAATQEIAYYPASVMPPPDAGEHWLLDRARALHAGQTIETPATARRRTAIPSPSQAGIAEGQG